MRNITINSKANTIEMTKAFANEARKFGSEAYKELQEARRDYPNYRVVVKSVKTKKESYKGLDYDFMKSYIKKHDDENQSKLNEFLEMRGLSKTGLEIGAKSLSYGEIKEWFFDTFPEIAEFQKKREAIINRVAENKAAKAA